MNAKQARFNVEIAKRVQDQELREKQSMNDDKEAEARNKARKIADAKYKEIETLIQEESRKGKDSCNYRTSVIDEEFGWQYMQTLAHELTKRLQDNGFDFKEPEIKWEKYTQSENDEYACHSLTIQITW